MKFDGYYILSDLLDMPNLATHGQQALMHFSRRCFLGVEGARPDWPEGKDTWIRLYGFLAFAWRILICVSLAAAAAVLYHGAGIVLAAAAIAIWVVIPFYKFACYMVVGDPINPPNRVQFLAIATTLCVIGFAVGNYVPYVTRLHLATVVDYQQIVSVRASVPGFVRELRVGCGQEVFPGDVLLTLENPGLSARRIEAELAVERSKMDALQYHLQGNVASYQVEKQNQASLSKRLAELNEQCDSLVVVASERGTVLSRTITDLHGRWIKAGEELVLLGNDQRRRLSAVVPQSQIAAVREAVGNDVDVHIWGNGASLSGDHWRGRIESVAMRGTVEIQYPALSAMAGGPLTVRPKEKNGGDSSAKNATAWQLLEPHFVAEISLPNETLRKIDANAESLN
jgi:putative peptide zinc metalloprotease protein